MIISIKPNEKIIIMWWMSWSRHITNNTWTTHKNKIDMKTYTHPRRMKRMEKTSEMQQCKSEYRVNGDPEQSQKEQNKHSYENPEWIMLKCEINLCDAFFLSFIRKRNEMKKKKIIRKSALKKQLSNQLININAHTHIESESEVLLLPTQIN